MKVKEEIERYRMECEARWVLKLETKQQRRNYLDLVGKKRGVQAMKQLENEAMRQFRLAKVAA